jgi:hypothetical protein
VNPLNAISALRSAMLVLFATAVLPIQAQPTKTQSLPDPLFQTLAALDAELFDAYNRCDLKRFESFIADELEFYHDQSGLSRGKQSTVDALKQNICGKVTRELVEGTLQVYPIANFGAVQMGVHRFHHPGKEATEPVGEAKFIHIWQKKDGAWKLTRIISIDHHAMAK